MDLYQACVLTEIKSLVFVLLLAVSCGLAESQIKQYIYITFLLDDAQIYCRQNYKDLVIVTSIQSGYVSFKSWTGLRRSSDTWIWSDGEPLSFPNWFWNFSVLSRSVYDCTVTSTTGLIMNYICGVKWNYYCCKIVNLVQEKMTWEKAQEYCKTIYTGLASEASLQQLKLETGQTESVWIGLRFLNGIWFWASGKQLESLVINPNYVYNSEFPIMSSSTLLLWLSHHQDNACFLTEFSSFSKQVIFSVRRNICITEYNILAFLNYFKLFL